MTYYGKTITVLSKGEFLFTAQRIPKGIVIASPINIAKIFINIVTFNGSFTTS